MKIYCFIFLLFASQILVSGEKDSLQIGETYLRLGLSKNIVMPLLNNNFNVSSMGKDMWLIKTKDNAQKFLGLVVFRNDKLAFVGRSWGDFENSSSMEKLFAIIKYFKDTGVGVTDVRIKEDISPNGITKFINLVFKTHNVVIKIVDNSVSFLEIINTEY